MNISSNTNKSIEISLFLLKEEFDIDKLNKDEDNNEFKLLEELSQDKHYQVYYRTQIKEQELYDWEQYLGLEDLNPNICSLNRDAIILIKTHDKDKKDVKHLI
ncbi:hypothetical protein [Candidatus Phytoplasma fraxini]|uniref:Uncharacterized protein n=1 Tax=Ash yellows phytoplasma TaxID=35780 RepID=A0ABZ2U8T6_ASHYP